MAKTPSCSYHVWISSAKNMRSAVCVYSPAAESIAASRNETATGTELVDPPDPFQSRNHPVDLTQLDSSFDDPLRTPDQPW